LIDGATTTSTGWFEYGERCTPAALTVQRLRPHLDELGITRLARQTGLDRIGIPCFSAIRPAGLTLSVSQGKGRDDFAAMASALMEAAEFAIAERPTEAPRLATLSELRFADEQVHDITRLLPSDHSFGGAPIHWLKGHTWPDAQPVWIPRDALTIGEDAADLPGVSRSTNGLASGNTVEEALFHAICELIERDASSLWSLLTDPARIGTEFAAIEANDPTISMFAKQIEGAGLELRLFDQTTDLGVPCVMAVITEHTPGNARMFDIAAGYGCHPNGARAIGRAITEAAQTRITNIAGGRDDFLPAEYEEPIDESVAFLQHRRAGDRPAPKWLAADTALPEMLAHLAERVGETAQIVWTELGGASYGISVVRALSPVLEDRETNMNWVPGTRALRVLGQ
jgi:YcaO-like protein with predicted kinase domain